jgi:hypothetical protein
MGSMQMAQTSFEKLARRSATSLKRTKSTPGMTGAKGSRYFSLCVVATEPMVRPWKLFRAPGNLVPTLPFLPLRFSAGVRARQLQRSLPRLGAGVAEEDAVQPADLGQAQRQLGLCSWK